MKNKKFAMILTGAGHQQGTEITEAVSLIVALTQLGVEISYFAPEKAKVGDFNPLLESQKITRVEVQPLSRLNSHNFDALVIPGGYGAATQLCSWASEGAKCWVHPEVTKIIEAFHQESKPIGAVCIAPALVARVLGKYHVNLTIGEDHKTAAEIEKTGATHVTCPVDDFITDRDNKVITAPAYMYGKAKPFQVFMGIQKLSKEIFEMS